MPGISGPHWAVQRPAVPCVHSLTPHPSQAPDAPTPHSLCSFAFLQMSDIKTTQYMGFLTDFFHVAICFLHVFSWFHSSFLFSPIKAPHCMGVLHFVYPFTYRITSCLPSDCGNYDNVTTHICISPFLVWLCGSSQQDILSVCLVNPGLTND